MAPERSDLNLFRVFDAVMRQRSLTAAGRELGITASAVSHALTRLRAALGEELFVSGRRGVAPTAHAAALAPRVGAALAALDEALVARAFDPATAERTFRIGASDHTGALFLPALARQLLREARGLRLRVFPVGRTDLIEHLDEGRLDLVLGWFGPTPERIRRRAVFTEREALLVRRDHPLAGRSPSRAELLTFQYLVVELVGGGELAPGGFLDERGFNRRVRAERLLLENTGRETAERLTSITVPTFGLVAPLLEETNLVATLPFRLARRLAAGGNLVMLDLPYEPWTLENEIAWHERGDRDPGLKWLAQQIATILDQLEDLP